MLMRVPVSERADQDISYRERVCWAILALANAMLDDTCEDPAVNARLQETRRALGIIVHDDQTAQAIEAAICDLWMCWHRPTRP